MDAASELSKLEERVAQYFSVREIHQSLAAAQEKGKKMEKTLSAH